MSVSRQVGTISAVDPKNVRARVRLPECDNLRTNWLDVLQHNTQNNKDYWLPDVGEQVVVLLDANGEDGVILGAVYSSVDTPPINNPDARGVTYADSAAFYYDRQTHTLTINGGIEHIVISCGADVTVKTQKATIDAPETEVTGNLLVKGKFTYQGGMAGSGGSGAAAIIQGNVSVEGDIDAGGKIMDKGGNSNHHTH
ncbi:MULTISPECIES: phage baseplate assembly protein V [unclassified Brenneria]|uniref:phage baseplate assembly protein V n=1 Tax=unclassified Brenneria TaxID=2634434 RepID=UPI0029C26017|nr:MULTISPECIES: phage baseplate assembly protein V [unclassified Brenneria]MDX5630329.1 phage baseplate assembly protein V [Brenneria sp. L3-3Z]MDX5697474.1 phage baseplate assembly protein V [Brenneria sp. L4-2C]